MDKERHARKTAKQEGFSIIIPVYNEANAVLNVIDRIDFTFRRAGIKRYEILAVNDCSTDKSLEVMRRSHSRSLKVLNHIENMGYGASLKTGIKNAKYENIIITDSDGTYPVEDMPKLVRYIDDFDMVVGSRTSKRVSIPLMRRPVKFVLNHFASYMAGKRIPDLNSGLRVFRKELAYKYWGLLPQKFSFTSTITMCCLTNGGTVKYIPINYYKRKGKSTIHPIKDTVRFFQLIFKLTLYFNPMRFFFPCFLLFFILGILRGVRDFLLEDHIGSLSLILFFIAVQVFFFGLLATIMSRK